MKKNEEIPPTLADYKAWLTRKYPKRRFMLDITQETYRLLRDNELKKLEK